MELMSLGHGNTKGASGSFQNIQETQKTVVGASKGILCS